LLQVVFDPSCFLIGNLENAGHEMQNVKTEMADQTARHGNAKH